MYYIQFIHHYKSTLILKCRRIYAPTYTHMHTLDIDTERTTQSECRLTEPITFFDGFIEYYLYAQPHKMTLRVRWTSSVSNNDSNYI